LEFRQEIEDFFKKEKPQKRIEEKIESFNSSSQLSSDKKNEEDENVRETNSNIKEFSEYGKHKNEEKGILKFIIRSILVCLAAVLVVISFLKPDCPTQKQVDYIKYLSQRLGRPAIVPNSKVEAYRLIDALEFDLQILDPDRPDSLIPQDYDPFLSSPPTDYQIEILKRYGWNGYPPVKTREEAKELIVIIERLYTERQNLPWDLSHLFITP